MRRPVAYCGQKLSLQVSVQGSTLVRSSSVFSARCVRLRSMPTRAKERPSLPPFSGARKASKQRSSSTAKCEPASTPPTHNLIQFTCSPLYLQKISNMVSACVQTGAHTRNIRAPMTRCTTVVRRGEGLQHNAMVEGTHTAASPVASPCAHAAVRARSAACTTPCSSAQAAQPTFASRTCAIQEIESTCNKHLCKPSALLEVHVQVQSCSMHEQGCRSAVQVGGLHHALLQRPGRPINLCHLNLCNPQG